MIRKKKDNDHIIVDLTGPDGNVFVLMGHVKRWAEDLGLPGQAIVNEMMESDYENAINVIEKYFGDYVILER